MLRRLEQITIDEITLHVGDRVRWTNFGGIAWTGTGKIQGLTEDYIGVTFERSPELDATRARIRAAFPDVFPRQGPVKFGNLEVEAREPSYPFGEAIGSPVIFLMDAARRAVYDGQLVVLPGVAPLGEKT